MSRPAHSTRCNRYDASTCCDNCWEFFFAPGEPERTGPRVLTDDEVDAHNKEHFPHTYRPVKRQSGDKNAAPAGIVHMVRTDPAEHYAQRAGFSHRRFPRSDSQAGR